MDNELEQKNIIIAGVETTSWGLKLTDEKGLKYNVPELKKGTNEQTIAYKYLSELPKNGLNLNKCVKFVTVPNNQGGQSRYVRMITEPSDEQGKTKYVSPAMSTAKPIKIESNEDEKWEKINFGKCKHQFLVEAYKVWVKDTQQPLDYELFKHNREMEAEEWATMSMRILNKKEDLKAKLATAEWGGKSDQAELMDEDVDVSQIPF